MYMYHSVLWIMYGQLGHKHIIYALMLTLLLFYRSVLWLPVHVHTHTHTRIIIHPVHKTRYNWVIPLSNWTVVGNTGHPLESEVKVISLLLNIFIMIVCYFVLCAAPLFMTTHVWLGWCKSSRGQVAHSRCSVHDINLTFPIFCVKHWKNMGWPANSYSLEFPWLSPFLSG